MKSLLHHGRKRYKDEKMKKYIYLPEYENSKVRLIDRTPDKSLKDCFSFLNTYVFYEKRF